MSIFFLETHFCHIPTIVPQFESMQDVVAQSPPEIVLIAFSSDSSH